MAKQSETSYRRMGTEKEDDIIEGRPGPPGLPGTMAEIPIGGWDYREG